VTQKRYLIDRMALTQLLQQQLITGRGETIGVGEVNRRVR